MSDGDEEGSKDEGGKKASGDWKEERIKMTHLASFSRSSTYVRTLIRQQFQHQVEPSTAWERMRVRLAKSGDDFNYEEETPSFLKNKEKKASEKDEDSSDEDEEDEGETYVYLKSASPERRSSTNRPLQEETGKTLLVSTSSARRQSMPLTQGSKADNQFTLGSTDAHSKILNRRLSLAENVIKNYSKYIRTPDETNNKSPSIKVDGSETESADSATRRGSKKPSVVAISEEESPTKEDVSVVRLPSPTLLSPLSFLTIPDTYVLGTSYTVPPSPVVQPDDSFGNPPMVVRRKSLSGDADILLHRSQTDLMPESTKGSGGAEVKARLTRTSHGARQNDASVSRGEAIKELRSDYKTLANNKRLNSCVHEQGATFLERLQRDQARRNRESAIFRQEMEEIMTTLKGINGRLDQRIKVLESTDPPQPKINLRLHRIIQQAMLGVPSKN